MINGLLDDIAKLLKKELAATVSNKSFGRSPLSSQTNSPLPVIALYPGSLTLVPTHLQPADNSQSQQEFQQEFWIEIESKTTVEVEAIASLVIGILTLTQDTLLSTYRQPALSKETSKKQPAPSEETSTYTSAQFGTTHRLRQINLLSGQPTAIADRHQWRLKGSVSGHLNIIRLQPESADRIQKVTIVDDLAQA